MLIVFKLMVVNSTLGIHKQARTRICRPNNQHSEMCSKHTMKSADNTLPNSFELIGICVSDRYTPPECLRLTENTFHLGYFSTNETIPGNGLDSYETGQSMLIGYARVSSASQSLDLQLEALTAAGCKKVFSEKRSGTTTDRRDALEQALGHAREGDTLVVTRLDRLARSMIDLRQIFASLAAKDVRFRCLQQGAIDTTRSDGKLLLNILASFAEFETDLRRERQRDGIDKAKAAGVCKGRPVSIKGDKIRAMHAEGTGPAAIARTLGIGRASVYRHLRTIASSSNLAEVQA